MKRLRKGPHVAAGTRLLVTFGLALTVSATLPSSRAGSAPTTAADYNAIQFRIQAPDSYVDREGIWEKGRLPIPVCWERMDAAHRQEREWVESIIATALEGATPVRFQGSAAAPARWSQCNQGDLGIRIGVADVEPWSEVGQQWTTDNRRRVERATRMVLNLDYQQTWATYCSKHKKQCVQVIALHEFMHAIGFLHEHLRSDAPEECKKKYAHKRDFKGHRPTEASASYDQWSIMNYCESIYREPIELSKIDVETVEEMYDGPSEARRAFRRVNDR